MNEIEDNNSSESMESNAVDDTKSLEEHAIYQIDEAYISEVYDNIIGTSLLLPTGWSLLKDTQDNQEKNKIKQLYSKAVDQ